MLSVPLPAGFNHGYSCNSCASSFFIFSWPCWAACRILVPPPGIEPALLALETWSLNHWTTREVLCCSILKCEHALFVFSLWEIQLVSTVFVFALYLEANIYLNIHSTKVSKIKSSLLNHCFAFSVKCNFTSVVWAWPWRHSCFFLPVALWPQGASCH